MLAKYNLEVGKVCNFESLYTPMVEQSGVQNSEMAGYLSNEVYTRYGVTEFSLEKYLENFSDRSCVQQ